MTVHYEFKTKNFTIRYEDTEETVWDISWDDTGECRAKLDSGEWQMFCAKVSVLFRGTEIAVNYLGGCIYAKPAEFRDHVGAQGRYGSYFRDMVSESVADARKLLKDVPLLRQVADLAPWHDRVDGVMVSSPAVQLAHVYNHPGSVAPKGWDSVESGAYASDEARRRDLAP